MTLHGQSEQPWIHRWVIRLERGDERRDIRMEGTSLDEALREAVLENPGWTIYGYWNSARMIRRAS